MSLQEVRGRIGFAQAEMARALQISLRAYQGLEAEPHRVKAHYILAAEMIAFRQAVEMDNPMLASEETRRNAIKLAEQLIGRPG